jgi:hypothetical protein
MKKPLIGILLGAFVYFAWGNVSWMMLSWHNKTMKPLPEEQLISDTLKTVVNEPGFYVFPSPIGPDGKKDEKMWGDKVRKGPIGSLVFSPTGKEPMNAGSIIFSIVGAMVVSCITMMILGFSRGRVSGILPRALTAALLGLLAGFATHFPYWVWFNFPMNFTLVSMADTVIAFFLMGIAQAAFVSKE